ncbi:metallophosphoesterase [Erysipelothrix larvae]|uniref:Metallophosphoesterase n=1 Tax=Erysipelothrix larvae TaxID=1514105 RepID=A0A0X8GZW3_9FIRM|nr:TIGR00282 family metallophosphoesterase [Erysipelothrix larvae]AMC93488.1 metallophosphoesterase [Erysipelothrix larvae]
MNILFIGDIVGASGRRIVADHLSCLKSKYSIDFTICNGENAAHGKGITRKIYNQFKNLGIDCITLGNHAFAKREIYDFYADTEDLLIPANIEPLDFGKYYKVYKVKDMTLCVVNLYGEAFMNRVGDAPYPYMEHVLEKVQADYYFVDYHAESTSEKQFMATLYKDKIGCLVGTHTHVQTNDARMIGSTAYITDVGMCGAVDSIIGRDFDELYQSMVLGEKTYFKVAEGQSMINAIVVSVDDVTKKSVKIETISFVEAPSV